jgi:hypothetical protein
MTGVNVEAEDKGHCSRVVRYQIERQHVRTMNYRYDRIKSLVGESLGLAVYRWIKISVE